VFSYSSKRKQNGRSQLYVHVDEVGEKESVKTESTEYVQMCKWRERHVATSARHYIYNNSFLLLFVLVSMSFVILLVLVYP